MARAAAPTAPLAELLLDAQVAFVLDELSGDRQAAAIERDTRETLELLDHLVIEDAVARDDVKAIATQYVSMVGDSAPIEVLATQIADAIYALANADDHLLSEVIGRDQVEALVDRILRMSNLRDRFMERLMDSPVVATVASWFVNRIVTDFMEANARRAERVPGVGMVLGAGRRAADTVRGQADRHLGDLVGDVAGKSAQFALRRLNRIIRETMDEAPLHDAVMEVWDLQASEPMSNLREYLSAQDLRDLVISVYEIWLTLRDTEYFAGALDAGIDVFFDNYGSYTVGALIDELGVDRSQILADAHRLTPPVVAALEKTGRLEPLVRSRLEGFWSSEEARALLG